MDYNLIFSLLAGRLNILIGYLKELQVSVFESVISCQHCQFSNALVVCRRQLESFFFFELQRILQVRQFSDLGGEFLVVQPRCDANETGHSRV